MRMKALIIVLLATVVGLLAPAPADAATPVTINRITVAPIAAGSKVTVRPALTVRGEVRIAKKYVTIWNAAGEKIFFEEDVRQARDGHLHRQDRRDVRLCRRCP